MSKNLPNMLENTMAKIREMVDANSVVGEPITTGDVTIIPISKISIGFGGGGSDFAAKNASNQENFGGGVGAGVKVMEGACVCDSVILSNVVVESGAKVCYSIIDSDVTISKDCVVGESLESNNGITVVAAKVNIPEGSVIKGGEMIAKVSDINKEDK